MNRPAFIGAFLAAVAIVAVSVVGGVTAPHPTHLPRTVIICDACPE